MKHILWIVAFSALMIGCLDSENAVAEPELRLDCTAFNVIVKRIKIGQYAEARGVGFATSYDYFVDLEKGQWITVMAEPLDLNDPFICVYDPHNMKIAENDDVFSNRLTSQISIQAESTGTYRIRLLSWQSDSRVRFSVMAGKQ